MAASKRDRQRQNREARKAAAEAARRRAARRRQLIFVVVAAVAVAGVALLISLLRGDDSQTASTENTTTTAAAGTDVGPCVPVADPLPAGAPPVPVKVGPPPTQLVKEDLKPGTGAEVVPGASVTVNYIGVACSTGKIFDSSYSRNQAFTTALSGVIKGWQDGIPGMKVGGSRLLGIPAAQAYGATGSPPTIGPNETLWFVVDVVETKAG